MTAMEAGVEARNLRYSGQACGHRFNRREVVRLMQGRQWYQSAQLRQHLFGHHHRAGEVGAAVDDTVSNADDLSALMLLAQPRGQRVERAARTADTVAQRFVADDDAVAILGGKARRCADTFNLSPTRQPPLLALRSRVGAELEARGPGVEYDNVVVHGGASTHATAGVCRRACA